MSHGPNVKQSSETSPYPIVVKQRHLRCGSRDVHQDLSQRLLLGIGARIIRYIVMLLPGVSVFGPLAVQCGYVTRSVGGKVSQEDFPGEGPMMRGDAVPREFAEVAEGNYGGGDYGFELRFSVGFGGLVGGTGETVGFCVSLHW
jgi:hypothetical protein